MTNLRWTDGRSLRRCFERFIFSTNTAGTRTEKNETDQKEQKPLFTVSRKLRCIGIVVSYYCNGLDYCALVYRKRQRRRQRRLMEQRRRRQRKEKQMRQSQVQTRNTTVSKAKRPYR